MAKKYRVNESEHFNLMSMYDHVKCEEIDLIENGGTDEQWDDVQKRLAELDDLIMKAGGVGGLVDWPTLKRIREIQAERQFIRYRRCIESGMSEQDANAYML